MLVWVVVTAALGLAILVLLRRFSLTPRSAANVAAAPSAPGRIPGLKPSDPISGNLGDIGKAGSLHEFLVKLHQSHGPLASFWWGKSEVVSIADVELWKAVIRLFDRPVSLFSAFEPLIGAKSIQYANGAEGQERRRTYVDSAFSHTVVSSFFPTFLAVAERTASEWREKLKQRPDLEINAGAEVMRMALRAMAITSLGAAFENDEELRTFREACVALTSELTLSRYEFCWYDMEKRVIGGSLPAPGSEREKRFEETKAYLHATVRRIADENRKRRQNELSTGAKPPVRCFIDALLDANVSDAVMKDDILSFLVGGFHTTASLLTWAVYFLCQNPKIQDRVVAEIASVFPNGEPLTLDKMSELVYLNQVISETLRCAATAPWAARVAASDLIVGGHTVPANTPIILALGVVLHDPRLWPSPSSFDPDRFSSEKRASHLSLAFSPFGFAGKRICPGQRFSSLEASVFLALLLRSFSFRFSPSCPSVVPVYGLTTHPSKELLLLVSQRHTMTPFASIA